MARISRLDRLGLPGLVLIGAAALVVLVLVILWVRGCGEEPQAEPGVAPDGVAEQPAITPGPTTPGQTPITEVPVTQPESKTAEPPRNVNTAKSIYQEWYDTGRSAFDRGEYISARNSLSQAIKGLANPFKLQAKTQLASIAKKLTFSRHISPGDTTVESYHVKTGEWPATVAKKYAITAELFMKINEIPNAQSMMAGKNYKVIKGPFNVVIHKNTFELDVFLGDYFIKRYTIGLGRDNSTPVGEFLAGEKLKEPEWIGAVGDAGRRVRVPYGDQNNPLGERWISLRQLPEHGGKDTDYGIHGTNDPATIGSQASRGCIRMLNKDVIELFDLLVRGKSRIMVVGD